MNTNLLALPAAAATVDTDRPLNVCICPLGLDFVEYQGTRAQLEAEGIIPAVTLWPDRADRHSWTSGDFRFSLRRIRPADSKVPKKVWIEGDWWNLRWDPVQSMDAFQQDIKTKAQELAKALHRHSPAGRAEFERLWRGHSAALQDKAFQAFKDLVVPPRKKPGRRSKANTG